MPKTVTVTCSWIVNAHLCLAFILLSVLGAISDDVGPLVDKFIYGKSFMSHADGGPDAATVSLKLGTVSRIELEINAIA